MESRVTALRRIAGALAAAGVPGAQMDARILLCAASGIDRTALVRDPERPLDPESSERLEHSTRRRMAREPVSRILGRREFWGLDLTVTPAVLDPRPDTETLVAAAMSLAGEGDRVRRILDLGTGSGAILCALLSEWPMAVGIGVDRSVGACRVARDNLDRLGLGGRCLVTQGVWGSALLPQSFDLVLSNPPYIETGIIPTLHREVRDYDPSMALDGGPDGLAAYRDITKDLPRLLAPGGAALLEVGIGQAEAVATLAAPHGLACRGFRRDLAGIERVVVLEQSDRSRAVASDGFTPA